MRLEVPGGPMADSAGLQMDSHYPSDESTPRRLPRERRSGISGSSAASVISKSGRPLWQAGSGCSVLSIGLVGLIVAAGAIATLKKAAPYLQGELAGGASARSTYRLMNNARQLALALRAYAGEHEGVFPESIRDLAPSSIAESELDRILLEGSEGSDTGEAWIYLPGLTSSSAPQSLLLAGAVSTREGKRIVALADGSVESWEESRALSEVEQRQR